jgi:CHASE2 domain-containing sensor protein
MITAGKLWPVLMSFLIALVAFGAMLVLTNLPLLSFLQLKSLDLLFLFRGRLSPPPDIIIVAIDDPRLPRSPNNGRGLAVFMRVCLSS